MGDDDNSESTDSDNEEVLLKYQEAVQRSPSQRSIQSAAARSQRSEQPSADAISHHSDRSRASKYTEQLRCSYNLTSLIWRLKYMVKMVKIENSCGLLL